MAEVFVFFADGMEEIEGLAQVDLLRRAGNQVTAVSIMGRKEIRGTHDVRIQADALFEETDFSDGDLFVLPGGGEGTQNLGACGPLGELLKGKYATGKRVAAICAAPTVLGKCGVLRGKKAVCFPSMEEGLTGAEVLYEEVVRDGNVITSRGMGTAIPFALAIIEYCQGKEAAENMADRIVFRR